MIVGVLRLSRNAVVCLQGLIHFYRRLLRHIYSAGWMRSDSSIGEESRARKYSLRPAFFLQHAVPLAIFSDKDDRPCPVLKGSGDPSGPGLA